MRKKLAVGLLVLLFYTVIGTASNMKALDAAGKAPLLAITNINLLFGIFFPAATVMAGPMSALLATVSMALFATASIILAYLVAVKFDLV